MNTNSADWSKNEKFNSSAEDVQSVLQRAKVTKNLIFSTHFHPLILTINLYTDNYNDVLLIRTNSGRYVL